MAASADDDEGAAKNAADANAAASSSKKSRKVSPASSPPPRRRLALAKLQRLAPVVFARSLVLRLKLLAVRVRMRKNRRGSALWLLVAAVACSKAVARAARAPAVAVREVPWSLFLQSLDAAPAACRVSDVLVGPQRWDFLLDGADRCYAVPTYVASELARRMLSAGVTFRAAPRATNPSSVLASLVALGYLAALASAARRMMGGGSVGAVGRRPDKSETAAVTFEMVAGVDEARREVMEILDLSGAQAQKYAAVGARPPRGVLLVGPPGTGKTLLARALASEAQIPFIYCSGSDFVEMYIGRGAARVRQLFARAAKLGRCVIFIDELDALGKARSEGGPQFGARDEAEQTLNQLLTCMDGLVQNSGVVVLAATNRLRVLDSALVRSGRFDRVVNVKPPDAVGREKILRVHARKVKLSPAVDLAAVAAATRGLVGADLAALVNEAAIRAVRAQREIVQMEDLKEALADFYVSRAQTMGPRIPFFSDSSLAAN